MPYHLTKHFDGSCSVKNVETGRVHSKHTTPEKAKAQIRLLEGIDHDMKVGAIIGHAKKMKYMK
jgi:hypothetical protein